MNLPGFGAVGVDSLSLSRNTDNLEFRDGLDVHLVYRTETGSVQRSVTRIPAWGIQGQDVNALGRTLESVSFQETEEVATHDAWTGNTPGTGDKLVYTDAFLILVVRQTMTVTGFGTLPTNYEESKHGTPDYDLTINSVVGSFSVSIEDAILMNPRLDKTLTDWYKFTFELQRVISTPLPDADDHFMTGLPTPPTEVKATNYTITRGTTLNNENWATEEITYEEHYGDTQAPDWE